MRKRTRLIFIIGIVFVIIAVALFAIFIFTSSAKTEDETLSQTLTFEEVNIDYEFQPEDAEEQPAEIEEETYKYLVLPENPRPGEPVTIGVSANEKEALLIVNGRQLAKSAFFSVINENGIYIFKAAVLTIPSTARPGDAIIRLINEENAAFNIPITIAPRNFVSEVIELGPVNTEIRTAPNPERDREANILWNILTTSRSQIYHTGPFVLPVTSTRRTSFFGDRRIYVNSDGSRDTSIHAGVDFGVPTGTEVFACGTGMVVLARMRISTGNTVVIEHAPGIYSLYYHMSSISVQEGVVIQAGTLVGLSGSTGISTGPHLHWEVRVSAENTDPDAFTTRPLIDKELIMSRIINIDD